jgi:hypothetical protein
MLAWPVKGVSRGETHAFGQRHGGCAGGVNLPIWRVLRCDWFAVANLCNQIVGTRN